MPHWDSLHMWFYIMSNQPSKLALNMTGGSHKYPYMQSVTSADNLRNPSIMECSIQIPHNCRPHWKYGSFTASTEPVAFILVGTDFQQDLCGRGHHGEQALSITGRKSRLRIRFQSLNFFLYHHLPLSPGVCKTMIWWIQRVRRRWRWSQLPSLSEDGLTSISTSQLMPMRALTCLWLTGHGQSWVRGGFLSQKD